MKVAHTLSDGLKHEFTVTIPSADIKTQVEKRLNDHGKVAKVPGFRPGKIPEALLHQRYGTQALKEVIDRSVENSVNKVFKDHKIRQAFQPDIKVVTFGEDKDLEFTVSVESLPEIVLKNFDSISLERLNVNVENEEVEKRLAELAKSRKKFVGLKKPRPAKKEDLVSFDILDVTIDGKKDKNHGKNGSIELGHLRNTELSELDKELFGKNIGDNLTVTQNMSFEETDSEEGVTSGEEAKKEKPKKSKAVFHIKVTNIEEPVFFDINDDLAKEFKLESLDDLRKALRENVENDYAKLARLHIKRFLLDKLADDYSFELPPTLVESEFKTIWAKLQEELKETDKKEKSDEKELQKEYRAISERRVRLGLLISEISNVNKIQVTEPELRMAIFNQAIRFNPDQVDAVFDYYRQNSQAVDQLAAPILEDKVVDYILSKSTITERSVTVEAFKKEIRGVIPTPFDDEDEIQSNSEPKPKAKKSKGEVA